MNMLAQMDAYGHEQVIFGQDKETGLRAIIAIHSTVLGPAVGGARFLDYKTEDDAIYDVMRLSRGMSLKNAAAGLPLGGGKTVLIGDPKKLKSPAYFHALGRMIDSLGGRYYTAEDVNTNTADIALIQEVTPYVTGTPEISGNPSPFTARGVMQGLRAGASVRFGTDDLTGMTVAVQGLGSVGYALCGLLHQAGAKLKVYDINKEAMDRAVAVYGAKAVTADEILVTECDILSPCALGAVFSLQNADSLRCRMICGAANNVLCDPETGDALAAQDILYLPDFIVNAGGIINCGEEIIADRFDRDAIGEKVDRIYNTVLKVLHISTEMGISTAAAAEWYALDIIAKGAK